MSSSETGSQRARRLRREAPKAERLLWNHLRLRKVGGARFRRQHQLGRYFTDFCCIEDRLVIELDGDSHAPTEAQEHDRERTEHLQAHGYRVMRFANPEVEADIEGVLGKIIRVLQERRRQAIPDGPRRRAGR
jgi:very-short-patch-repair endonuclease